MVNITRNSTISDDQKIIIDTFNKIEREVSRSHYSYSSEIINTLNKAILKSKELKQKERNPDYANFTGLYKILGQFRVELPETSYDKIIFLFQKTYRSLLMLTLIKSNNNDVTDKKVSLEKAPSVTQNATLDITVEDIKTITNRFFAYYSKIASQKLGYDNTEKEVSDYLSKTFLMLLLLNGDTKNFNAVLCFNLFRIRVCHQLT